MLQTSTKETPSHPRGSRPRQNWIVSRVPNQVLRRVPLCLQGTQKESLAPQHSSHHTSCTPHPSTCVKTACGLQAVRETVSLLLLPSALPPHRGTPHSSESGWRTQPSHAAWLSSPSTSLPWHHNCPSPGQLQALKALAASDTTPPTLPDPQKHFPTMQVVTSMLSAPVLLRLSRASKAAPPPCHVQLAEGPMLTLSTCP